MVLGATEPTSDGESISYEGVFSHELSSFLCRQYSFFSLKIIISSSVDHESMIRAL